jgi:large subunit ribosomal protein LP2
MKHLEASLLLVISGNTKPSASDIREVLESVGIEADDSRLLQRFESLRDKSLNECIDPGYFCISILMTREKKLTYVKLILEGSTMLVWGFSGAEQAASAEEAKKKEEDDSHFCNEGDCSNYCGDDDLGLDLFE